MHKPTPTRDPQAVVSRFAQVAREILIGFYGKKSCVESTRVALECLKRFDVRAEVVPVSLRAQSSEGVWVCGLSDEELGRAPPIAVNRCPPGQAWRGHHVAMAEGEGCRYLIDASFDQIEFDVIKVSPMVLVLKTEPELGTGLGTIRGFLNAEFLVHAIGISAPRILEVTYAESADRSFVNASSEEIASLHPAINLICQRMAAA